MPADTLSQFLRGSLTALLLAVLAAPGLALAQTASDEVSGQGNVFIQADQMAYDRESEVVTATGNVEIVYGDRILMADKVAYDRPKDTATADGNIALIEPTGDVIFANHVVLENEFKDGVATGFSALLTDDSRLAAVDAVRKDGRLSYLHKAVFSPCEICEEEGQRTPLWQIKASRVIHDQDAKDVIYEDARMEFFGIPVFYTPFLTHPDPSVKHRSGLLTPSFGASTELGYQIEIPLYWSITPSMDATFAPLFSTKENPVWKGEFRQRLDNGEYQFRATGTSPRERPKGTPGDTNFRGSLFGRGNYQISDLWETGFEAELTTDDTYLRRYDLSNQTDLTSRIYLNRSDGRDQLTANAYYFQGLLSTDDPATTPWVAPIVDWRTRITDDLVGGRLDFRGNFMALGTEEAADSNRISAVLDWNRPRILSSGMIVEPFARLRGDLYLTDNVTRPDMPALTYDEEFVARFLPTAGIQWRYPFVRETGQSTQVIEPILQAIVSPDISNSAKIPNEDSQSLEFDTTNLFQEDRFPGFDLWEAGPRAMAALSYSYDDVAGRSGSVLFGQSYRISEDDSFSTASGLRDVLSDYVGKVSVSPFAGFRATYRFRLNQEDLSFRRNEFDLIGSVGPVTALVGYGSFSADQSENLGPRKELNAALSYRIDEYWRTFGGLRRDIENKRAVTNNIGVAYQDECFGMIFSFSQNFTRDRDVEPSSSVMFQVTLKHLGSAGVGGTSF